MLDRPLNTRLYAHGFSLRKRGLLRSFTQRTDIAFITSGDVIQAPADLLLWGGAPLPPGVPVGTRIVRCEDGFLRSVGLGADWVRPLSWVLDGQGIYFDSSRPSDLELLLQQLVVSDNALQRARHLRERLLREGVSKYNLMGQRWQRPKADRPVVLVTGQVQTDASIRFGAPGVNTNMGLLQAVRRLRPDAWLVYKPHPDVVAGLRSAASDEHRAKDWSDEIAPHADIHDLLNQVDEVHVLTSLAGFEALLRDKPVTCHGQPFYAGWGLTNDCEPIRRRQRQLTIDELVVGALIQYPLYQNPNLGTRCEVEDVLDCLLTMRSNGAGVLPRWRKMLRPLLARP